jgi:SAM-dependent methyltransferase
MVSWGGLAEAIGRRGVAVDYTGLDLSEENVRSATERGVRAVRADAGKPLPVEDEMFDCVFCLELLEPLESPLSLLREIRRVLRARGRAVISVPNPYNWVEVYREWRSLPDTEGHLASMPTPVMANLLALAEMRIERRLGTSMRFPKTRRLIVPRNSILARARLYVAVPDSRPPSPVGRRR